MRPVRRAVGLVAVLLLTGACAAPTDAQPGEATGGASAQVDAAADTDADVTESALLDHWAGAVSQRIGDAVVAGTAPPADLRRVASATDEAWRRCRAAWPEPVDSAVVLVPETAADARQARWALSSAGGAPPPESTEPIEPDPTEPEPGPTEQTEPTEPATSGDAADDALSDPPRAEGTVVATTLVTGRPPEAVASVHLAPRRWRSLSEEGLRVVLTHECLHVALSARPRGEMPLWLVEGVAEYVAYRDSTVAAKDVLAPLIEHVAQEGPPSRLPADGDFDGSGEEVLLAYAQAHSAARTYADLHGEQALLDLVITPQVDVEEHAHALLGPWQEDLRARAHEGRTR